MNSHVIWVVLLVCSFTLFRNGVEGATWNLTKEEDLELERQLKQLNKPSVKTISTDYGDIYDCVDFYKQPAFDHPLLKNYTVDFQLIPSSLPQIKARDYDYQKSSRHANLGLKDGGCPIGTVPIRRITKEDLIRERLASIVRPLGGDTTPGAHYAVYRTQPPNKYDGAGCSTSVYNPQVTGQQYSAAKVKIFGGPDSIEAGWRVDPTLYGDTRSRLFVRLDAGQSHCFDTRCPGFIITESSLPVGGPFNEVSQRGGPTKEFQIFLVQDQPTGNWFVEYGADRIRLGYWPKSLFTSLAGGAEGAEWGGEVFSPPNTPKPAMGAGYIPVGQNTLYDAYFRALSVLNGNSIVDAKDYIPYEDSNNYKVFDEGFIDNYYRQTIFYGGSGGSPTI